SLFRLMWVFFRIGAMNEMQYRVNFLIQLLQSLIALGTGLIALALVFSHTTDLGGWSRPELLAVMGVHILMGGLIMSVIQPNMERLAMEVQDGTLDYALTKPEDAQVLISVREIRIWQTVDIIIGLIVLIVAVIQLGGTMGIGQALGFALALLLGGLMIYSFWLMLTSTAFWVVRIHEMVSLFQGIYQAGRWPVSIYPNWLRIGLTFLVPLAFAVTVPAEALTGRLTLPTLGLAAALTIALLVLARFVWRLGLRAYSGASA
ncbi:MAG: ABC-2 family transporter protein, partial [Chloroflexales bacterium]|nr:ABC-2 family transporter protein [Chloroflexales bacterium]